MVVGNAEHHAAARLGDRREDAPVDGDRAAQPPLGREHLAEHHTLRVHRGALAGIASPMVLKVRAS